MSIRSTPTRYGSVAIAIHWTSAAAILLALVGGLVLGNTADPATKLAILPFHLALGLLALLLTLLRIGWWLWADRRPAPLPSQPKAQERAAAVVHGLLYLAILVMGISGIATMALSGAIPAMLAGGPLPDFAVVPPRLAHGIMARVLLVLLAAHIGAALWHQFIRRDHILARMGIGA